MAISKRQKVYLSILAVALGALVLDRVFLGSGGATPGRAAVRQGARRPGSRQAAPASPPSAPGEPAAPEGQRIAARLRAAAQAEKPDYSNVRDVFAVPPAWMAELEPPAPDGSSADEGVPDRPAHKLMAVMVGERGGHAIIDGRCLLVGQERDGLKLISVAEDAAVVEENGVRIQLQLQKEESEQDGTESISN